MFTGSLSRGFSGLCPAFPSIDSRISLAAWDYYATGDRSISKIYVVNQTEQAHQHGTVSVAYYTLDGTQKYFKQVKDVSILPFSSAEVLSVARVKDVGAVYFVRCALHDGAGNLLWTIPIGVQAWTMILEMSKMTSNLLLI